MYLFPRRQKRYPMGSDQFKRPKGIALAAADHCSYLQSFEVDHD
jgi:hypothetical protein